MAKLNISFENVTGFEPVPENVYEVVVKSIDMKKPKDTTNPHPYLNTRFEITEGEFAGRQLFVNLTTNPEKNKNGNASNSMLYSFLRACGENVTEGQDWEGDSNELINTILRLKVLLEDSNDPEDINPKTGELNKVNNVRSYMSYN